MNIIDKKTILFIELFLLFLLIVCNGFVYDLCGKNPEGFQPSTNIYWLFWCFNFCLNIA